MRVRFSAGSLASSRLFVALVLSGGALVATACGGPSTPAAARGADAKGGPGRGGDARGGRGGEPREVKVTAAVEDRLVRAISVAGTLAAEEQVTLSMKVTGRLNELFVDLGSPVSKGQVIARLIPTDFSLRVSQADAALQQARVRLGLSPQGDDDKVEIEQTSVVRQARAVLEEAKLTKGRTETFVQRGIAARADLDAADAALKVAEGRYMDSLEEVRNRQALLEQRRTELELARQALRDSSLTSPLDGVVRERHVTVGQYLAAGSPAVTIVRINPLRLRVSVPERESQSIRQNQTVRVTAEGNPKVYEARIARVSPAIDESTRSLMVEAEVPNPRSELRPGSFANAEIVTAAAEPAILVPASALVSFAGVDKILVVRDGKVSEKRVTTGRREGGRIEIVAGLAAGDPVITDPGSLVEGDAVRPTGSLAGTRNPAPAVSR